ncbi:hypothetical protein Q1695_011541 [Nippostrongylus brasiliensis]|nr:hypothetical protein Q1695_011541 [Nippostrongylus brasiliensis]
MSPRLGAEKPRPINLNQVILVTDLSIFECHQICDDGSAAFINRLLYGASANTEFLSRSYKGAPVAEEFAADRYCYLACDFLGISTCFAFRLGRRVRRYKNRVPIAFFLHASRVFQE